MIQLPDMHGPAFNRSWLHGPPTREWKWEIVRRTSKRTAWKPVGWFWAIGLSCTARAEGHAWDYGIVIDDQFTRVRLAQDEQ